MDSTSRRTRNIGHSDFSNFLRPITKLHSNLRHVRLVRELPPIPCCPLSVGVRGTKRMPATSTPRAFSLRLVFFLATTSPLLPPCAQLEVHLHEGKMTKN